MIKLKIVQLFLVAICGFLVFSIGVIKFPWYVQKLPYGIGQSLYEPGDAVEVSVERNAKINLVGRAVVELVRLKNGVEEEVYSFTKEFEMNKGKRLARFYYMIPSLLRCPVLKTNNSEYFWRGGYTFTPIPGLPEIEQHFYSEKFHIKVKPDA